MLCTLNAHSPTSSHEPVVRCVTVLQLVHQLTMDWLSHDPLHDLKVQF